MKGIYVPQVWTDPLVRPKQWKRTVHQIFIVFQKDYDSVRREVLYNIIIEFVFRMKLVRLTKWCLSETYSTVGVDKNLFDMFPTRKGLKRVDGLSPFLIKFALEYDIRRVQVNHDGMKLNGTHRLSLYVDDVNILVVIARAVQENAKCLVVVGREYGMEVNGEKTKYMAMSRDQDEGRSLSKKFDNSSFERLEEFEYLGTNNTSKFYSGRN
jgi:hypothetical protein